MTGQNLGADLSGKEIHIAKLPALPNQQGGWKNYTPSKIVWPVKEGESTTEDKSISRVKFTIPDGIHPDTYSVYFIVGGRQTNSLMLEIKG